MCCMIYHNDVVSFQILTMCIKSQWSLIAYNKSTGIITMKNHVDSEHNGLIHAYEIAQVVHRSKAKQKKTHNN
jgi:hypothetical protein